MIVSHPDQLPCSCPSRYGCERHGPQVREHAVLCRVCKDWLTWATDALCSACAAKEEDR